MRKTATLSRISTFFILIFSLRMDFYLPPAFAEFSPVVLAGEPVHADYSEALEQAQNKIKEIEEAPGLDEPQRKKLLELYRLTKDRLQAAKGHRESVHAYQEAIETAPARIEKLNQQLAHPEADSPLVDLQRNAAEMPLPELEQQLTQERTRLATLENTLASLDKQLQEQQHRPRQAREQLTEARQRLERVEKDLQGPLLADDEFPPLAEARRIALRARMEASLNEIRMLEQELLSHSVRLQLLTAQRELTARWVSQAQARIKFLQELIIQRRELEVGQAKAATARAEQEAAGKHPAIQRLAEQNARLGEGLAALVAELGRVTALRETVETQLNQIKQAFKSTQQRLEIVGLNEALRQTLQNQRRSLPEPDYYRQEVRRYNEKIAQVGLDQLRIDEQRRQLSQMDEAVAQILDFQVEPRLPPAQQEQIETEIRSLLKEQQALLDKFKTTQSDYLRALGDLDFALQQLIDTVQQYRAFLDDRLLLIPSASLLGINTLPDLLAGLRWLLLPGNWLDTARGLRIAAMESPLVILATILAFIGLLLVRSNLRRTLGSTGERIAMPYADRFGFTVRALIATLMAAAPWPLLLGVTGRLLRISGEASIFAKAVGVGLTVTALPLFLMHGFRLLCREDGVAQVHFGWQTQVVALWRRNLAWAIPVILPALFLSAIAQVEEAYADSLGRMGFMASMVALAIFFQRLLRPKGGIVEQHLEEYPKGWLARFRYGWYPAIVGFPLTLAGLAVAGYFYTALQLKGGLIATLCLLLLAGIVQALVIRWLRVAQRKLALVKLREKREAERRITPSTREAARSGELNFHHIDIETVDVQTRHLLRMVIGVSVAVGLWFIWAPTLSALGILDDVILWQRTVIVEGQEVQRPFTLANLALALALALIAMGAARNLPGFLEIAVLKRLSLTPGSRYAITALARYAIGIAGILLVFEVVGGSWAQIQWLVAALTVGLGFGLQEIFANFVSGLIILFERPVRVGDVVTVGDISGTVSRIRIRATTITDFDHKELIVPNKSFITEKVVNWTLSDSITRITLNVRIAYGSDTVLAHQIIVDAVKNHPLVLQEPAPNVYFVGFGESSLHFVVWAFVKELGNRFPLIHELNTIINRSLREQGIEIPLPQRDIFVRSSPPMSALEKFNPRQESEQAPLETPLEAPPSDGSQKKSANTQGQVLKRR